MDGSKMEQAIRDFLAGMGVTDAGPGRFPGDDLSKTPARVARAWQEDLVSGYAQDPLALLTWTDSPGGTGVVCVRDLSFASICAHHLLPFSGFAQIAYLPGRRIAGLSKIGRVVDAHARRLQTQENLTAHIVATLEAALEPRGVVALLTAEHTCMTLRGVRKEQSAMSTMASSGIYETDLPARAEVLSVLTGRPGHSAAR